MAAVPAFMRGRRLYSRCTTSHYDTPDQALRRQRAALRIRRGRRRGSQWLQTLQDSRQGLSAPSQRGEWEVPWAGPPCTTRPFAAPPWRRLDLDGAVFAALEPCFSTDFERTGLDRAVAWRRHIEVALDVGVIAADGRTAPVCELELELLSGAPEGGCFAWPDPDRLAQGGVAPCLPARLSRALSWRRTC